MSTTSTRKWTTVIGTKTTGTIQKPEEPHIHLPSGGERPIAGLDIWEVGQILNNFPPISGAKKFTDVIYTPPSFSSNTRRS